MRAVKIKILGKQRYMIFTGEAMFTLMETFGGIRELLEKMQEKGRGGFEAVCSAGAVLLEQGELARRYMGYEAGDLFSEEALRRILQPKEIPELTEKIIQAIELGYGREIQDENEEIDLGLCELNQKKTR